MGGVRDMNGKLEIYEVADMDRSGGSRYGYV